MGEAKYPRFWLALLLLLFTGYFGLHRLYLGKKRSAAVMLSSVISFCLLMYAAPTSSIAEKIGVGLIFVLTVVLVIDLFRISILVDEARWENST
ncbi:MAG: NINE protein [Pseudomonadota bacterium]